MNTTETSLHLDAARAIVHLLPSAAPLDITEAHTVEATPAELATAVTASFVGNVSADVALVFPEAGAVAEADSDLVTVVDVLRSPLEGATAVLGAGVLSEARTDDAAALFADDATTVFRITSDAGTVGWFAIRTRGVQTTPAARAVSAEKLGRINSVEMALTVEIGRTRMSVREVLSLEPGTVIELDRSAGAPADILLNGRLIAHGEIVVVDQDYAVRITEILDTDTPHA
ncbi:flagellar motor switch protein FliN [Marisediminicola antarctica]|uniref:Flagellar motor switch protein FliN n=1 Tax=Marisediminicola antarctica TaxID=674079 RepID=A0A7L5AFB2_9MICO|nr:flagellar motor switch protein FliN [Marisediminicola antarctica]QHO68632.1 flagellar motor switch protein FliN [Marisediminicola antarctica]